MSWVLMSTNDILSVDNSVISATLRFDHTADKHLSSGHFIQFNCVDETAAEK